jgi:predicted nucleotide-binding protein (sugar kinase/HSP70/actin superfamily)
MRIPMTLRNKFIAYTEMSRNAEELLRTCGAQDNKVIEAFHKANQAKQDLLTRMDDIEKYIKLAEREASK